MGPEICSARNFCILRKRFNQSAVRACIDDCIRICRRDQVLAIWKLIVEQAEYYWVDIARCGANCRICSAGEKKSCVCVCNRRDACGRAIVSKVWRHKRPGDAYLIV